MQRARNVLLGLGSVVIAMVAYNVLGTSGPVTQLVRAPTPFGFAEPCNSPSPRSPASVVNATRVFAIESNITGPWRTVYSDGGLAINADTLGEAPQVAIGGNTPLRYQLSPAGVDLIQKRVVEAGITPGCRRLSTSRLDGHVLMWTDEGYYDMAWGKQISAPTARLSSASETALGELLAQLTISPISLPGEAWTEGGTHPSLLSVDHWLVLVHVVPTAGLVSGSENPYADIALPGGVAPLDFGMPLSLPEQDGPGSSLRCGLITPDDAALLASSLFDSPTEGVFAVTTDLSTMLRVVAEPIFVANYGCADFASDLAPGPIKGVEMPPVTGLLAGIDPCGFVSAKAMGHTAADTRVGRPSLQPFGVPARSCVLSDSRTGAELATVALYPDRAVGNALEQVLAAAFGRRPPTEDIGGQSVFHQDQLFAINNGEEFVTIEFGAAADRSTERAFVSAVATQVH